MEFANTPLIVMVVLFFIIAALFIVVRGLSLPKSYFRNEKARSDIRLKLREKEFEEKQLKNEAPPAP